MDQHAADLAEVSRQLLLAGHVVALVGDHLEVRGPSGLTTRITVDDDHGCHLQRGARHSSGCDVADVRGGARHPDAQGVVEVLREHVVAPHRPALTVVR